MTSIRPYADKVYSSVRVVEDPQISLDLTPPAIPTNLVVGEITGTSIVVSATGVSTEDLSHYNGYYRTSGSGSYTKHNSSNISNSTLELGYTFDGLSSNTEYDFYFTSVDLPGNESEASELATDSTLEVLIEGWYDSSSMQSIVDLTDMPIGMRLCFGGWDSGTKRFYIPGPYDGSNYINTMYIYDPLTGTWTTDTGIPSHQQTRGCFVQSDGLILFGGGFRGAGYHSTYDPLDGTYDQDVLGELFATRVAAQAYDYANDIIYYSGDSPGAHELKMGSSETVPPGNDTQYSSVPNADTMYIGNMTFYNGLLYVLPRDTGGDLKSFMSFNPGTDTFTALVATPFEIVRGFIWEYDGNIYVHVALENSTDSNLLDGSIYKYDVAGNSWSLVTDSMPTPAEGICYATREDGKQLWCFGGHDGTNTLDTIQLYVIE